MQDQVHYVHLKKVIPDSGDILQKLKDDVRWYQMEWRKGFYLPRLCYHNIHEEFEGAKVIRWLRTYLLDHYDCEFELTGTFANFYRSGEDYLPHHRDQYEGGHVISLSFGATRIFSFNGQNQIKMSLESGDIVIFDPYMNKHYTHGIPRQLHVKEPRINITCFVNFTKGSPYEGKKIRTRTQSELDADSTLAFLLQEQEWML